MITEHQEIAKYRVAEQVRAAETHALLKESRDHKARGPRHELAGVLRRLADRLEPEPRAHRTRLSVVR